MTDWTICQKKRKEKLKSNDKGRKSLASLSPKFSTKKVVSFDIKRTQVEGQDLKMTLNSNNVSYHNSCKNTYNNRIINDSLKRRSEVKTLEVNIF